MNSLITKTGGLLGATIVQQLNNAVNAPSTIPALLGAALPASSTFFLAYVAMRALFLTPLRMVIPHMGVLAYWFRCCGRTGVLSARERADMLAARSPRYGYEYGMLMLMFLIGLAFTVAAPLVPVFSLLYFLGAWVRRRRALRRGATELGCRMRRPASPRDHAPLLFHTPPPLTRPLSPDSSAILSHRTLTTPVSTHTTPYTHTGVLALPAAVRARTQVRVRRRHVAVRGGPAHRLPLHLCALHVLRVCGQGARAAAFGALFAGRLGGRRRLPHSPPRCSPIIAPFAIRACAYPRLC